MNLLGNLQRDTSTKLIKNTVFAQSTLRVAATFFASHYYYLVGLSKVAQATTHKCPLIPTDLAPIHFYVNQLENSSES